MEKQYKKLFVEAAKAAKARIQVDEQYLTEVEEDKALLKLMGQGKKERERTGGFQTLVDEQIIV